MHGRPLGAVEHAELNAAGVDAPAHLAAQGVDLADDLPLGDAADGRVAAHLRHGVGVHGQQGGAQAQPRRGQGGLNAGVAGADDNHVEVKAERQDMTIPTVGGVLPFSIGARFFNFSRFLGPIITLEY